MDNRQNNLIAPLIDELAANIVLLDLNSAQDTACFKTLLECLRLKAQEAKLESLVEAVDFLFSAFAPAIAAGEDRVGQLLASWISIVQDYLSNEKQYSPPNQSLFQCLKIQFDEILNSSKSLPLDSEQSSVFREIVENGLGILVDIEKGLLVSDKDPDDEKNIDLLFRLFHTLKGEIGLVGLKNVFLLAHAVEGLLEKIRSHKIKIGSDLIVLLLSAKDELEKILKLYMTDIKAASTSDVSQIESKIINFSVRSKNAFLPSVPVLDLSEGPDMLLEFITESTDHLDRAEEALMNLGSADSKGEEINTIFRSFHTIKGVSSFLNLEDVRVLSHETETMMDYVRSGSLSLDHSITDAVFHALDALRKLLVLLKEQILGAGVLKSAYFDISETIGRICSITEDVKASLSTEPVKKLGDILVEKEIIDSAELSSALDKQKESEQEKKIGEILVEMGVATSKQVDRGLSEQKVATFTGETIKIAVRKLDDLVDTMGELVITGTQVIHHPEILKCDDVRLRKDIAQLDRIIRDIQNISMAVRLVPIRPVFQKMVRLARDLSVKSGKKVEVKTLGEDTEIDKNITELISDPLMHMVRNAVDHGIESSDLRKTHNKPVEGCVTLNAYHKGGNIIIEISDDGGGLDRDKILKKAIERGLATESEVLLDERIYHFIFEPGFSTAEKITDVSGRGVGMDVVKRNIEQLQGRIDIETKLNEGTKFMVRLPLTLAIIEGIVVKAGGERYILPIFAVEEFIQPNSKDITTIAGRGELINIHGSMFPLVRLDSYFNVSYKSADVSTLTGCLVNSDYGRLCLLFDGLIGQQQVVIKNLGNYLKDVKGLSGATILGDGRVGLILDVNGIASLCKV